MNWKKIRKVGVKSAKRFGKGVVKYASKHKEQSGFLYGSLGGGGGGRVARDAPMSSFLFGAGPGIKRTSAHKRRVHKVTASKPAYKKIVYVYGGERPAPYPGYKRPRRRGRRIVRVEREEPRDRFIFG